MFWIPMVNMIILDDKKFPNGLMEQKFMLHKQLEKLTDASLLVFSVKSLSLLKSISKL